MILKAAFPTIDTMYEEDWKDFADMQLPYILERVIIADRGAAERFSADWDTPWTPPAGGAYKELRKRQLEDGLPPWVAPFGLDVPEGWWAPARAALRAYYNLKKQAAPVVEVTDPFGETSGGPNHEQYSEVAPSEMDRPDFDAEAFVKRALAENGMEELLRLYTKILGETRALDAEKKALVYDNYSKLITATETIRKVGVLLFFS